MGDVEASCVEVNRKGSSWVCQKNRWGSSGVVAKARELSPARQERFVGHLSSKQDSSKSTVCGDVIPAKGMDCIKTKNLQDQPLQMT